MIVVVDTSVLIDHLRGDPRARSRLREFSEVGDRLSSVTVVRTEILAGMRDREHDATHALLDCLSWHEITVARADAAGALARQYLRSHPGIDTIDSLLAAATVEFDARLLTSNVKHFPMFPGLRSAYDGLPTRGG